MLLARAAASPDRLAFVFEDPRTRQGQSCTFGGLHREALRIASSLSRSVSPGGAAVLVHPPGLEFIAAFMGCLYAGVRPAPVALSLLPDGLEKISTICVAAEAAAVLGVSAHIARLERALGSKLGEVAWIETDQAAAIPAWAPLKAARDDIAFLQFSSGSTGDPKGIAVSHGNVMHNVRMLNAAFRVGADDLAVSWLPHHHDMGLVAGILHSIYSGIATVLLSPLGFLLRPRDWLEAISRHRATLSAAPDFAYAHCARTISDADRAGLDLSSWAVAITGSEMVRAETLAAFADAFTPCGFDPQAFYPSYGLAEATLMVSGGERGTGAAAMRLDPSALDAGRAVPTAAEAARTLISCGPPRTKIVIVDPVTGALRDEGVIGEVLVAGASVAHGYYRRPEATAAAFGLSAPGCPGESFLRTGDLGFLLSGNLTIVGRLKDLVVVRGRNVHPEDVEASLADCHPAFRAGRAAAFGLEVGGEEQLAVVQEVDIETPDLPETPQLVEVIRTCLRRRHDIEVAVVVLAVPGQIPKTTSGKVQRQACRAKHLAGGIRSVAVWART